MLQPLVHHVTHLSITLLTYTVLVNKILYVHEC